ncbi:MAG: GNAT family N-acetyltransferase [Saprospiraceae bacterium]
MKKSFLRVSDEITLHPPYQAYAKSIFAMVNAQRSYLGQWLPWVHDTLTVTNTEDFLKLAFRLNQGQQQLNSIIFYKEALAGSISLIKVDQEHKMAEMGYWLSQDLQGKGIITKAAKAMITHSFAVRQLNRIEIRVAKDNFKSKAIPQRLGFQLEGTLRECYRMDDGFVDLEVYGLLRKEWVGVTTS